MKVLFMALSIISFSCQISKSQILITEELKNKLCYDAFGIKLEEQAVYPDGRTEQLVLYPESMITVESLISHKIWGKNHLFETLPYDILRISTKTWADQFFLIINTEIIPFDIYFEFPVVLKQLLTILEKHHVDDILIPLFCERLSNAYLYACYDEAPISEKELVKMYQKYW